MSTTTTATATATIDPRAAHERLASGASVLVDVREPDEHAAQRIAGAMLLPLSRFDPASLRSLGSKSIILHCKSGRRSADAARMASGLVGEGFEILSLAGGIEAWRAAGLPVTGAEGRRTISVMRQVQLVIGAGVLAGTAAGYFVHPYLLAVPAFFGAGLIFAGATGTCGLASLLGLMPWNRAVPATCAR